MINWFHKWLIQWLLVLVVIGGLVGVLAWIDDGDTVCRGAGYSQECWDVDDPSGPGRR